MQAWKWLLLSPFKSRKVQLAICTVVAAILAEKGYNVSADTIYGIFATGIALIGGTAIEDAAKKKAEVAAKE